MNSGKLTVICGHYGSGKTNLSINLAIDSPDGTVLADMDIVNPYFTSSEHADLLKKNGTELISPVFAGTNMEITALPASVNSLFDPGRNAIIDAGGDPAGATVLGRFSDRIKKREYEMWYVTNMYRPATSDPENSAGIMREIENACKLKVTGIVNNSHLKELTTASVVTDSLEYARNVAAAADVPLICSTVSRDLLKNIRRNENFYPVDVYVATVWEKTHDKSGNRRDSL